MVAFIALQPGSSGALHRKVPSWRVSGFGVDVNLKILTNRRGGQFTEGEGGGDDNGIVFEAKE